MALEFNRKHELSCRDKHKSRAKCSMMTLCTPGKYLIERSIFISSMVVDLGSRTVKSSEEDLVYNHVAPTRRRVLDVLENVTTGIDFGGWSFHVDVHSRSDFLWDVKKLDKEQIFWLVIKVDIRCSLELEVENERIGAEAPGGKPEV
jgi:hypothetical protein